MSRAADEGMQGAVMSVDIGDSVHYLTSYRHMQNGSYLPVTIPGTDITLGMYGLEADKENLSNSKATIVFASPSHPMPPAKAAITLDVSIKPFISFVWAGVIIMVGGFFFSIIRRRKEIDAFIPKPDQGDGEPRSPQGRREPVPAKTLEEPIAARTGLRK